MKRHNWDQSSMTTKQIRNFWRENFPRLIRHRFSEKRHKSSRFSISYDLWTESTRYEWAPFCKWFNYETLCVVSLNVSTFVGKIRMFVLLRYLIYNLFSIVINVFKLETIRDEIVSFNIMEWMLSEIFMCWMIKNLKWKYVFRKCQLIVFWDFLTLI